jgi:outer membrane biosynthesis protein TonB
MHVDPVLDTDLETLGYLSSAPTQEPVAQEPVAQEPVAQEPVAQEPVPVKKRIVKKKTVESAPVTVPKEKQDPVPEYTPIPEKTQEQDPVPVPTEKKRVIKKKPVASLDSLRTDTDITQSITTPAIPAIPAPPATPAPESITDVAKLLATSDATGGTIQKKIIKKKK